MPATGRRSNRRRGAAARKFRGRYSQDRDTASVYFTVSIAALETSPFGLVTWTARVLAPAATATVTFNCEAPTNVT